MHSSEFGHKVKNYLSLNKELKLSGLGVFKIHHINQYLDSNNSIIHPPQQKIRFLPLSDDHFNSRLTTYYVNRNFRREVNGHFQNTINDVLNFGVGKLNGIGQLTKGESGGISFTAENLVNSENRYLPIINTAQFESNISSVKVQTEPDQKVVIANEHERKPSNSSPLTSKEENRNFQNPTPKNPTPQNSDNRVVLWSAALFTVFMTLFIIVLHRCDFSTSSNEVGVLESSMFLNEESDSKELETGDVVFVNAASKIVVGSFKKRQNAQGLMNELSQNYSVNIVQYNHLYRVILDGDLDQIQQDVTNDAWLLSE